MAREPKTLEQLRATIQVEIAPGHLRKEFSSNVVAFSLRAISARFGVDEANRAIRDMKLGRFGWSEQSGEEPIITPRINSRDLIDPLQRIEMED